MANKNDKPDGIIEPSAVEKTETAAKPVRPPKPKRPLGRDTKVGLAVIGALLVIFVVVLVIRLRGDGDSDISKTEGATDTKKAPSEKGNGDATSLAKASQAKPPTELKARHPDEQLFKAGGRPSGSQPAGGSSRKLFASDSPAQSPAAAQSDNRALGNQGSGTSGASFGQLPPYNPARNMGAVTGSQPALSSPLGSGNQAAASDIQSYDAQDNSPQSGPLGSYQQFQAPPFSAGDNHLATKATDANATAGSSGHPFANRATSDNANIGASAGGNAGAFATDPAFNASKSLAQSEKYNDPGDADQMLKRTTATQNPDPSVLPIEQQGGNPIAAQGPLNSDPLNSNSNPLRATTTQTAMTAVQPLDKSKSRQISATANAFERATGRENTAPYAAASNLNEPAPLTKPDAKTLEINTAAPLQRDAESPDVTYEVKGRESYWTIAESKYGSGAYFRALFQYNQRQSGQAEPLQPGTRLRIPDEATLQRLYPELCPRPRRLADASRATRASANIAVGREYVVQEGDTLYEIARRKLGTSKRWAEIYELNRDTIGGVMVPLEPNMTLVLPGER